MKLTEEQIEEIRELAYTVNFYIDSRWSDESQQQFAQEANQKQLAILTGGAYTPPNPVDTVKFAPKLIPIFPADGIEVTPVAYPRSKWAYAGSHFPAVIAGFTPEEFRGYVQWVKNNEPYQWTPTGITAHHTAWPNLDAPHHWANGWTAQLIKNARSGYINDRGFDSGPHIFSDQNKIWVMNPLSLRGIHAASFNHNRYGVEMLLDGENQAQINSEKGQRSIRMGQTAIAILMKDGGISKSKLNFHRDDKKTSKNCPGSKIAFVPFEKAVHAIYDTLS